MRKTRGSEKDEKDGREGRRKVRINKGSTCYAGVGGSKKCERK